MKRGVTLLICLVLLGGLIGVYFYLENRPEDEETPSETPSKSVKLIEKQKWDIESIRFISKDNEVVLLPVVITPTPRPTVTPKPDAEEPLETPTPTPTPTPNISFTVSGFEDAELDQSAVDNMARMAYALDASEMVAESGNPQDFRLDPPEGEINVKYADGTEKTILVGMQSPAKDYYYIMIKGDPAIYMVYTTIGERAFYNMDKILSKTLPTISAEGIEYIYVAVKGKDPVEFAYDGTEEEFEADMEQFGGVLLYMVQPNKGWELYGSNFQTAVLDGMSGMRIGDMIEINPEDYSVYGLDDPSLTVWLRDVNGELHLVVGDDVNAENVPDGDDDKTYVYVKFFDRPPVYIMDKSYLNTLYSINPFNFSQRFIALLNIDHVDAVTIKSASQNYDIFLNHEVIYVTATPTPTPTPTPEPDPDAPKEDVTAPPEETESTPAPTPMPEKLIHPTVNSQEVQEKAFKTFYQSIIGLSYDTSIDPFTPTSLPEVTIAFKLNNGEPNVTIKFFKYNNDFYAVQKDEGIIRFVVSKQYVEGMFKSAEDLLAGKLDR